MLLSNDLFVVTSGTRVIILWPGSGRKGLRVSGRLSFNIESKWISLESCSSKRNQWLNIFLSLSSFSMHLKYFPSITTVVSLGYPGYFRPENLGGMFKNFLLDDRISGLFYLFGAAINTAGGHHWTLLCHHCFTYVCLSLPKRFETVCTKETILLIEKSSKQ